MSFINFIVLLGILSVTNMSQAETARRSDGGQAALVKAQMLMRQLSDENQALKNTNMTLKSQQDAIDLKILALKKSKNKLNKSLRNSKNINQRYQENTETLQYRIAKDRERMQELIAKFKELIQAFRVVEQDKARLTLHISETKSELLHCAENNMKLVDSNRELVEQYTNKGIWAAIRQAEPFTQLNKVEVEKIAQEYAGAIKILKISVNKN